MKTIITKEEITISTGSGDATLRIAIIVILVASVGSLLYYFSGIDSTIAYLVDSSWFIITLLSFVVLLIVKIYYDNKKLVIFSAAAQAVYSQTIFGRRLLMHFDRFGAIKIYNKMGVSYFALYDKDNLHKLEPPRISPYYGKKKEDELETFARHTVPAIEQMIQRHRFQETIVSPTINDFMLRYFKKEGNTYYLRNIYMNRRSSILIAVVLLVAGLFALIKMQTLSYGIGAIIGSAIMLFILTEKIFIQDGMFYSRYAGGFFARSYPLINFLDFDIIHERTNFIYTGTTINLVFIEGQKNKHVFLCMIKDTKKIEGLLQETAFIINKEKMKA